MQNLPPPFVLDPPPEVDVPLRAGSRLSFIFTAFGRRATAEPQMLSAIDAFGRLGLTGLHHDTRRAKYQFLDARDLLAAGRSLHVKGNLNPPVSRSATEIIAPLLLTGSTTEAVIEFVTPVRILPPNFPLLTASDSKSAQSGQPPRAIRDFHDFILLLTDRVAGLWQLYGDDWRGQANFFRWRNQLLQASKTISVTEIELQRRNYTRYASDQRRPVQLDGFTGAIHVAGDLTPFLELILLGEITHLGESTAYGFGQYKTIF